MNKKFEITGEIDFSYDENSPEFIEAYDSYKECMERGAEITDMLRHVAFHVTRFGTDTMVEGVGYVGYNGRKPTEKPYSGIMVSEDYDEFLFNEV